MSKFLADECIRSKNVLLLPGMMCDRQLWGAQVGYLAGKCAIQVGDITGAESIESIARQQLSVAPARFALAGLSMGGIVALEMWRQAPARIERLALLDSNFRSDAPERRPIRERQMADVAAGGLERVIREELMPQYLAQCLSHDRELLGVVHDMAMRLGSEVFRRQSVALRDRRDATAVLADIDCPTLVLCGDEDRLCSPGLHREMASRIPGAILDVIPACGHLSTIERPEAVNLALERWLKM